MTASVRRRRKGGAGVDIRVGLVHRHNEVVVEDHLRGGHAGLKIPTVPCGGTQKAPESEGNDLVDVLAAMGTFPRYDVFHQSEHKRLHTDPRGQRLEPSDVTLHPPGPSYFCWGGSGPSSSGRQSGVVAVVLVVTIHGGHHHSIIVATTGN